MPGGKLCTFKEQATLRPPHAGASTGQRPDGNNFLPGVIYSEKVSFTGDAAQGGATPNREIAMDSKETIVKQAQAALEHVARVNPQGRSFNVFFDGSLLTLEGEVPSVAAKKMAIEAVGMVSGVRGVIDHLRVGPAEINGNGALRTAVCQLLLEDVDFRNCTIRAMVKGRLESLREQGVEGSGCIVVAAEGGVVTLTGDVISLTHKRLAGVMAWWTQGCRDVVNALVVTPPEEDTDDEVTDALRLVLETDRRVHAEQIGIRTENHVITLEGVVASEDERRIAEQDAWYLYAVDKVINRLEVRP